MGEGVQQSHSKTQLLEEVSDDERLDGFTRLDGSAYRGRSGFSQCVGGFFGLLALRTILCGDACSRLCGFGRNCLASCTGFEEGLVEASVIGNRILILLGFAVAVFVLSGCGPPLVSTPVPKPTVVAETPVAPTPALPSPTQVQTAAVPTAASASPTAAPPATPTQVPATLTMVPAKPVTPTATQVSATPTMVSAKPAVPTAVSAPKPGAITGSGLVINAQDSPKTDREGICRDNAWAASQIGLPEVAVRSVGYLGRDGWVDNCIWDSTGNVPAPYAIVCMLNWACTVRHSGGEVVSWWGEAQGRRLDDVTSFSVRYLDRYPKDSPFHNDCYWWRFERDYGLVRSSSYETRSGNIKCPEPTTAVWGDPLAIVAEKDRSVVNCNTPQTGIHECTAARYVVLTHPAGTAAIDLWPSFKEPEGVCRGEPMSAGNQPFRRIFCNSPTQLPAVNAWTYRE